MGMEPRDHWEAIYRETPPEAVSWYRPHMERSLEFLRATGLGTGASVLDVGGGNSTLVDDLLREGFSDVTVLDISPAALAGARERLGAQAGRVTWIAGDVTALELPRGRYDFWHDRAVFHFLTDAASRRRYVAAVRRSLKPGGHIVVATFGPRGPERCSGLPVARYDPDGLHGQFGGSFRKVASAEETHVTPWGAEQEFVYCYCRILP